MSLFYALVGGLLLAIAADIDRHRKLVNYVGWGSVAGGATMLFIDMNAGIPWWWTIHEGPVAMLFGVAVVWLAHSAIES